MSSSAGAARSSAVPPPATIPSSAAARVAASDALGPAELLLELWLGGAADADHRQLGREPGQALLQHLDVGVLRGAAELDPDLRQARIDVVLGADAIDEHGLVLVDHRAAHGSEVLGLDVGERQALLLGDHGCRR